METPAITLETLFVKLEAYLKTTFELSKLKFLDTIIKVASLLLSRICVVLTISVFILVLNIGIALFLGELLGKSYYGFFIVAAFYLVAGIVLHFFLHAWIKKPISDLIIKQTLQ